MEINLVVWDGSETEGYKHTQNNTRYVCVKETRMAYIGTPKLVLEALLATLVTSTSISTSKHKFWNFKAFEIPLQDINKVYIICVLLQVSLADSKVNYLPRSSGIELDTRSSLSLFLSLLEAREKRTAWGESGTASQSAIPSAVPLRE